MSIHSFPRCAGYLKGMRVKLNDPAMTDYWFAVIVADAAFDDDELVKAGTVNFDTMRGEEILAGLETLFPNRKRQTKNKHQGAWFDSLKACLGVRGVKVSSLKTDDEYWEVAMLLWPSVIKRNETGHIGGILSQIQSMSKKQRSALARRDAIPEKWRAKA
ncbi:hypothetical protein BFS86_19640 [Shewanella algae]|nr:hypothetical protein BFS86_19640 [Shewanella algae]